MASETTPSNDAKSASNQQAKSASQQASAKAPAQTKKREREVVEITNELPPVWEPDSIGDQIEGFYIGPRVLKMRSGPFITHTIQNEETGELLSFSGAIADTIMLRLTDGAWCRVTYDGLKKTGNGRDAKQYKIGMEKGQRLLPESEALARKKQLLADALE